VPDSRWPSRRHAALLRRSMIVAALLGLVAALAVVAGGPAQALPANPWTGQWLNSADGTTITLTQSGPEITGPGPCPGTTMFPAGVTHTGRVSGDGTTASFTYSGAPSCPGVAGTYQATMRPDAREIAVRGTTQFGTSFTSTLTYQGGGTEPRARLIHFKVDTHARNVRSVSPRLQWFQLGVSRLNGSGYIEPDGTVSLERPIKLFQFIKSPRRPRGPFVVDGSVQWRILGGQVVSRDRRLNFGDRSLTRVYTLTLDAVASQSVLFDRCPLGTRARITLVDDARRLRNGDTKDRAEVIPIGSGCPGPTQGWTNNDCPNCDPRRGGIGQGQHAQVNIRERSIH
jgi:hypothetical protein